MSPASSLVFTLPENGLWPVSVFVLVSQITVLQFTDMRTLPVNDCGKWVNNVGNGARYDGTYRLPGTTNPQYAGVGECTSWNVRSLLQLLT